MLTCFDAETGANVLIVQQMVAFALKRAPYGANEVSESRLAERFVLSYE